MSKNVYEDALESFSTDEQNQITLKMREWGVKFPYGQRITRNFPRESFLPLGNMKAILHLILNNRHLSTIELETIYETECYRHVLLGGDISPLHYPTFFGVAIEKGVFKYHLEKNYKRNFPNSKLREEFIEGLITNSSIIGSKYAIYKRIRLKKYSLFSTWNHEHISKKPFEFTNTNDAQEVRANLGLKHIGTSKQLLLFVYSIPTSISPQKPTIADAGLCQYFEPPLETERHGWTINWGELPPFKKKGYNMKTRPECIHDSILLDSLILPVERRT